MIRQHEKDTAAYPIQLTPVPKKPWPPDAPSECRIEVYLCRRFLVQVFQEACSIRISVNRTKMLSDGKWEAGISWDDLMRIKHDIGMGDMYAVEVYPRDVDTVNVSNMRHLWVLPEPLTNIGWFK
jgi:hypothetical protein